MLVKSLARPAGGAQYPAGQDSRRLDVARCVLRVPALRFCGFAAPVLIVSAMVSRRPEAADFYQVSHFANTDHCRTSFPTKYNGVAQHW